MPKYTAGPWEASEGYPSDIWHVDMPSRKYSVVVSRAEEDWDMAVKEVQANAHLIAAAPELLDALETLLLSTERDDINFRVRAMEAAREAIAKAEGGE